MEILIGGIYNYTLIECCKIFTQFGCDSLFLLYILREINRKEYLPYFCKKCKYVTCENHTAFSFRD